MPPYPKKEQKPKINLDAIYKKLRLRKLEENPMCQAGLNGCTKQATECHHRAGRRNYWLVIYEFFLSVCRNCHDIIGEDSNMAYDRGFSLRSGHAEVKARWQWVKDNLEEYIESLNLK